MDRELSVVVVAPDIEGRINGLLYRCRKGITLVGGAGVDKGEGCV